MGCRSKLHCILNVVACTIDYIAISVLVYLIVCLRLHDYNSGFFSSSESVATQL